ncbi:MAG: ABC transporter substrate-binding protein [Chloroflexota bacterium]|nr:ABC transporter substrate-binding protein [Dehalococcoidia bacterium]MDW8253163.1 ABC transporter substrate-binding protein [Chloroflexota bacterium]
MGGPLRSLVSRLGFIAVLVISACAPAPTGAPASPATGEERAEQQRLNIILGSLVSNLTPAAGSSGYWYYSPLYDSMVVFGDNFEVKPAVLTKWDLAPDGRKWTLTVRDDMNWPDGAKLTAEDVAFSYNLYTEQRWPAKVSFFNTVVRATALNATTVELELSAPDASVVAGSAYAYVIPKHYYERVGFEGFSQRPMGSGPYELVEWVPGDTIRYKKRPVKHAFRAPVADELYFKAIIENSQKINGLRTGEFDIITFTSFTAEQIDQLKRLNMVIFADESTNWSITFPQVAYEQRDTPLKDKRVRLAFNYAVDKQAMADNLFRGYAKPSPQQYSIPSSPYWDPTNTVIPYDPAMARRLLAEAGYPNGFRLPYGIDNAPAQSPVEPLLAVQSYLRDVGVEFEIHSQEWSVILAKVRGQGGLIPDLWAQGNTDSTGFASGIRSFWGCGKPIPNGQWYCNPEWDRLMAQAVTEVDPAKRRQLFLQANRIWKEDVPMLYLLIQPTFHVTTPKVKGWKPVNFVIYNFDSAYKIK